MKRKYVLAGVFALMRLFSQAQTATDADVIKVNKTQIDLVYNQYVQDGNNSAITGGLGTEKLTVYGPALKVKKQWTKNALHLNIGSDVITSASADKIDAIVSSASAEDTRAYFNGVFEHQFKNKNLSVFGGTGISVESDYLSLQGNLGFLKENKANLSSYSAEVKIYSDDLRWGRLSKGKYRPITVIYPKELRYQQWYDEFMRYSYNLILGYTKPANKRAIIGIFPTITYQKGLLATPFHRVYFEDGSLGVEQLPNERIKGSVALKWNQFVQGKTILKNTLNPYIDNYGIIGAALQNETAVKITPTWIVFANLRVYIQKGSEYFSPYMEHQTTEEFFTSDYDLSTFQSYNIGIGLKYAPYKLFPNQIQFNKTTLRYNYFIRTDGMRAHIFSMSKQLSWDKKSK